MIGNSNSVITASVIYPFQHSATRQASFQNLAAWKLDSSTTESTISKSLPQPRRLCFNQSLSVCLSVCLLANSNFMLKTPPPPPSLPWSARTVGASHESPPVVCVHSHHRCFLNVFTTPHQNVVDPSPYPSRTPMISAVGSSDILQIWPNSWSFLWKMVYVTVNFRCT